MMMHPEPEMESLAGSDADTVMPAVQTLANLSVAEESHPSSPADLPQIQLPTVPQRPSRTHIPRASAGVARQRIQDTLEWENCDESSGRFLAVARRLEEEFDGEELEDGECEQVTGSHSEESESAEDDDESYESSFVTDGSGSEEEDSEEEWTPIKKVCCHSVSNEDGIEAGEPPALEPPALEPPAVELVASECVSDAGSSEGIPEPRFLHDEELNSPAGFYKLWVL